MSQVLTISAYLWVKSIIYGIFDQMARLKINLVRR